MHSLPLTLQLRHPSSIRTGAAVAASDAASYKLPQKRPLREVRYIARARMAAFRAFMHVGSAFSAGRLGSSALADLAWNSSGDAAADPHAAADSVVLFVNAVMAADAGALMLVSRRRGRVAAATGPSRAPLLMPPPPCPPVQLGVSLPKTLELSALDDSDQLVGAAARSAAFDKQARRWWRGLG
jgi:hypothetical protein